MTTQLPIPLSHSLLVHDRAVQIPDTHVVGFIHQSGDICHYTAKDVDDLTNHFCSHYSSLLPSPPSDQTLSSPIGLLAGSSMNYVAAFLALQRLGHTPVLISNRLAPNAIYHLLKATNSVSIIADSQSHNLISSLSLNIPIFKLHDVIGNSPCKLDSWIFDLEAETGNLSRPAWLFHSSGSTGLPKAVVNFHTDEMIPSKVAYVGKKPGIGLAPLPLFHRFGMDCLLYALQTGIETIFFPGDIACTGSSIIAAGSKGVIEVLYVVPYVLGLIAEAHGGIEMLRGMEAIVVGGGTTPKALGDRIIQEEISLVNGFGCTEIGAVMITNRLDGRLWEWMELMPHYASGNKVFFEHRENDVWEMCIGPDVKISTGEDKRNPKDGVWRMGDMFQKHPKHSGLWKHVGRMDDLLVLENGENWNPNRVELAVKGIAGVEDAVGVGAGRSFIGLFVFSTFQDEKVGRELVWEAVERVNTEMPAYGRLEKEAIIWRKSGDLKKAEKTTKGNIIRPEFYRKFEAEITEFYESFERQPHGNRRRVCDVGELEALVKTHILDSLRNPALTKLDLHPDADLFSLGLDSQKAMVLRLLIMGDIDFGEAEIQRSAIYDFPTIRKLTAYLGGILGIVGEYNGNSETIGSDLNRSEIDKFNDMLKTFTPPLDDQGDHILITGATGHIGSYLLRLLLDHPRITTITCLVRASTSSEALHRIRHSPAFLESPFQTSSKLEVLPITSLSETNLGLIDSTAYGNLLQRVTVIIHAAWSVNFLRSLSSFSPDLRALQNLLIFSLACSIPPRFYFISSIAAGLSPKTTEIPEGPISFPNVITETLPASGYGRSKILAEHILLRTAAQHPRMRIGIFRLGQIIGSEAGGWSEKEAWPAMLSTAITLGCLPRQVESGVARRWLLVDTAVEIISELMDDGLCEGQVRFWNLIGSTEVNWTTVLEGVRKVISPRVKIVDPEEWLGKLKKAVQDGSQLGWAGQLLEHYEHGMLNMKKRKHVTAKTEKTAWASKRFRANNDQDIGKGGIINALQKWIDGPWKDLEMV